MGKPSAWTAAKSRSVYIAEGARGQGRRDPASDPVAPEFKFLVLMLEKLGCAVRRAHEGAQSNGLFVLFSAPYATARRLAAVPCLSVSLSGYTGRPDDPSPPDEWRLSWSIGWWPDDAKQRDAWMRVIARDMVRIFGPLPPGGSRRQPPQPRDHDPTKEP